MGSSPIPATWLFGGCQLEYWVNCSSVLFSLVGGFIDWNGRGLWLACCFDRWFLRHDCRPFDYFNLVVTQCVNRGHKPDNAGMPGETTSEVQRSN